MLRVFHRYTGLFAMALVLVLALSGVTLSIMPAWEKVQAPAQSDSTLNVAELTGRILAQYPGVEQIKRAPSGRITAYYFVNEVAGAAVIDPATGRGVSEYNPSPIVRWLTNFHRALLLGDTGRLVTAAGALAMLVMTISGLFLLARRMGGWKKFFARTRGPLSGRLHVMAGRFSAAGLVLATTTALLMTLNTFDLMPVENNTPDFPQDVSGQTGVKPTEIPVLLQTPIAQLRELTFPYPDDPTDVFTLSTDQGEGYVDQGTGEMLAWKDAGPWQRLNETVYMLHTGKGAWWLGLLVGLMVLGVPLMAATGVIMWWTARRARPAMPKGVAAKVADTVVLVGSEGGTTWGFAATLHRRLADSGHKVHTAALSRFDPEKFGSAQQIIVLAATFGAGEAPASAKGFLAKMKALKSAPSAKLAVLGFGDRQFPDFCRFAQDIVEQAAGQGWPQLIPLDRVDRQSPQDFARWGHTLGAALGHELELAHEPLRPRTHSLTLISRRDYGHDVQAPTAILRFALPKTSLLRRFLGRGWKRFEAGDMLAVLPTGSNVARFYSLASGSRDGWIEICAKKHPNGLCSGQLLDLRVGDSVESFIRRNPGFRPARNRKPVILIGAGTGIGPLAGFTRANSRRRPMHLYFGIRNRQSDLLYGAEMPEWLADKHVSAISIACSRAQDRAYVQDILLGDAPAIVELITNGAQILVCGGRDMAAGVSTALNEILAPHGLEPAYLKAKGRYVEDVY